MRYQILAGFAAIEAFDHARADQHFDIAAQFQDVVRELNLDIDLDFGRSQVVMNSSMEHPKRQAAWDLLATAFDRALERGETAKAIQISRAQLFVHGLDDSVLEVYERAVNLPVEGSNDHGWLLARYGVPLTDLGRYEDGGDAFDKALSIAEATGDRALNARVLAHQCQRFWAMDEPEQAVAAMFLSFRSADARNPTPGGGAA